MGGWEDGDKDFDEDVKWVCSMVNDDKDDEDVTANGMKLMDRGEDDDKDADDEDDDVDGM